MGDSGVLGLTAEPEFGAHRSFSELVKLLK